MQGAWYTLCTLQSVQWVKCKVVECEVSSGQYAVCSVQYAVVDRK